MIVEEDDEDFLPVLLVQSVEKLCRVGVLSWCVEIIGGHVRGAAFVLVAAIASIAKGSGSGGSGRSGGIVGRGRKGGIIGSDGTDCNS